MYLFAVYLGGAVKNCNVEAHDLVFIVADSIEHAKPRLKQMWYGEKDGVHIDGYLKLEYIDNYEVQISETKIESQLKLYFINIGFTLDNQLIEQHEYFFIPAVSSQEAEVEAKRRIRLDSRKNFTHKDNLLAVDNCLEINSLIPQHINLIPTRISKQPELHSVYILL
jgi:Domain of Unknown Function (DUF1543)